MKAVAYFDRAVTAAVPPPPPPRPERQRMGGVKFPERKLRSSEFDRIRLPALIPMNVFQNKYVSLEL
ncbi:hypothetical protein VCV18_010760 [Metarhizium anisopliae]